uniref:DUF19 domain-containing protein n=1 Tax=Panagrolaimus davidi TaxID=227884 RepID=A0A914QCL8_9BILA
MFTHYICTHDFETTLKKMECNKEIKKEEKCPSIPKSKKVEDICKFISNRRSCIKDAMIQKCGNKELAHFYFDVEIEISKIAMPLCFAT